VAIEVEPSKSLAWKDEMSAQSNWKGEYIKELHTDDYSKDCM